MHAGKTLIHINIKEKGRGKVFLVSDMKTGSTFPVSNIFSMSKYKRTKFK